MVWPVTHAMERNAVFLFANPGKNLPIPHYVIKNWNKSVQNFLLWSPWFLDKNKTYTNKNLK